MCIYDVGEVMSLQTSIRKSAVINQIDVFVAVV